MIQIFELATTENLIPRNPVILLFGAPLSGKGTQGNLLSSYLKVPVFQTGNLFRQEVRSGSDLGKEISTYMESGKLIPSELTISFITKTLSSPYYQSGVIMDGYPRNYNSLANFENTINTLNIKIDFIIFLDASYELLISRILNRRVCKNCNRSISLISSSENCCENPDLIQRLDDDIEIFEKRYKDYQEKTLPLIEALRLKYPQKFIHLTPESHFSLNEHQVHELIIKEMSNLP